MNLKEMTKEEIIALVGKKRLEIIELIENIDNQTNFECYGTLAIGVENDEATEAVGGVYGRSFDIAQLYANDKDMMTILAQAALFRRFMGDKHDN